MIKTITLEQVTAQNVSSLGVVRLDMGKRLSPEEFLEVARRVGRVVPFGLSKYRPKDFPAEVTLLDNFGDGKTAAPRSFGEGWHQDSTFLADPPAYTVLHAQEMPRDGGDTFFADTRQALSTLSGSDYETLSVLRLQHAVGDTYRIGESDVGRSIAEISRDLPTTRHPVIKRHPRVGCTLWLSPLYTKGPLNFESRSLRERVLAEVIREKIVHKWRVGDVLIWDNRVVLHAATNYQGAERRRLLRTVVCDIGYGG